MIYTYNKNKITLIHTKSYKTYYNKGTITSKFLAITNEKVVGKGVDLCP